VTGLYIHLPFCSALCPYCDFAVVVGREPEHERYVEALLAEHDALRWTATYETVFLGGGTPSFVAPALLARLIPGGAAEVSLEANPESVAPGRARAWAAAGVTRVSVGAQSFGDHVLRGLGRTHRAAAIAPAVEAVRSAGIEDVNLDLIYGGPSETAKDWTASLREAVALRPTHVSCYALTIEERTAFGAAVAADRMPAPDEDALADRYERAIDVLGEAGFEQYEISNWSLPGRRCRHNLSAWRQDDYLGLGIGAHSHRAGHRWWNVRSLPAYLRDPARARAGEEHLAPRARAEEWAALRLRLLDPIDVAELSARLDRDVTPVLQRLAGRGLLALDGSRATLTTRGKLLENVVTGELIAATVGA